ncbi:MAG: pilus assembly protein PilM, partial [Candidatus Riflebacteria bacterium HGW-Riflebacteria-2]
MGLFTFGNTNTAVGVDIGTSAVKIVQLKKSPSGPELINYGMMPLPPDCMTEGAVGDPQTV